MPGNALRKWTCAHGLGGLGRKLLPTLAFDRYRTPSAIGSAIGRPLSLPISHPNTGGSPQPPRSKPLWGAQPRDIGAIVSKTRLKQTRNKDAIESGTTNHTPPPQRSSDQERDFKGGGVRIVRT